jgi:dienelactone hydrolase
MLSVAIISDIFGRCDGLQCLCADVALSDIHIRLLDPYRGEFQRFDTEAQAYDAFIHQCGHDAYMQRVVNGLQQPVDLAIGFSAGANALWRAAALRPAGVKQMLLFYPGQLHLHLSDIPEVNTTLMFGATEQHFCVDDLRQKLQPYSHIKLIKTTWQHGFMNPASAAFSADAYQQHMQTLQQLLLDLQLE